MEQETETRSEGRLALRALELAQVLIARVDELERVTERAFLASKGERELRIFAFRAAARRVRHEAILLQAQLLERSSELNVASLERELAALRAAADPVLSPRGQGAPDA